MESISQAHAPNTDGEVRIPDDWLASCHIGRATRDYMRDLYRRWKVAEAKKRRSRVSNVVTDTGVVDGR
jgi:hypothetical protein